ncbi:MAG: DUF1858 domain-containing protein [Tissierellia bacterium]|nr:DUF1858 domain-containing protein [Tissierellia bacterium]
MKVIDFNKTVYELWKEDENIALILAELGFKDIAKAGMINTAGRFMTIPKGARIKGFNLDEIREGFKNRGYEVKE